MTESPRLAGLWKTLREYESLLADQLSVRWAAVPVDLSRREVGEVCGAMLARQTRLGIEFARSPRMWNSHVAPVLLRTMVDLLINLKWVLSDPVERSRKFILYGLGQVKLEMGHRKIQLESEGYEPDGDPVLEALEAWLNSQRFTFLTEVDVGSWSGISVRDMAREADCLGLLNYSYSPFSAATHSMWHHIGRYNVEPCASPLHRHHGLPSLGPEGTDLHCMDVAAKYVERAFEFYESAHGIEHPSDNAYDWLIERFEELDRMGAEDENDG